MKAFVQEWRDWSKDQSYPVLIIETEKTDLQGKEALKKLSDLCTGLQGKGYLDKLAAINNVGQLVIDIGTLLALYSSVYKNKVDIGYATGWLASLVKAKEYTKKVEILPTCRCGQSFKNEKVRKAHLKKCSVIQQDMPLLRRAKEMLDRLSGKKVSSGEAKDKGKELGNTKGGRVRSEVLAAKKANKEAKRIGRHAEHRKAGLVRRTKA